MAMIGDQRAVQVTTADGTLVEELAVNAAGDSVLRQFGNDGMTQRPATQDDLDRLGLRIRRS